MRTKVCGITSLHDAELAVLGGAWALGFNFYRKSPRYIAPGQAAAIIEKLPRHVLKAGIFIDEDLDEMLEIKKEAGIDLLQVYRNHPASSALKRHMILSLQAASKEELPPLAQLKEYGYVLLDAPKNAEGLMGGTGRTANWNLAQELASDVNLLLAGGIGVSNVAAGAHLRPFAIDLCSGIEKSPGIKDIQKLEKFLKLANLL